MKHDLDLLVLGLGNVLFGDDGLGVIAVELIRERYEIPEDVRVADGGTLGLVLLPLLQQSRHVLIVDAIRCPDMAPGGLVRLDGGEVAAAVRDRLSPHQVGVSDLLDAARLLGGYPAAVTLLGLVPQVMEWSVGRSKAVEDGMSVLVEAIVREVQSLGYKMVPLGESASRHHSAHVPARHFGL